MFLSESMEEIEEFLFRGEIALETLLERITSFDIFTARGSAGMLGFISLCSRTASCQEESGANPNNKQIFHGMNSLKERKNFTPVAPTFSSTTILSREYGTLRRKSSSRNCNISLFSMVAVLYIKYVINFLSKKE